MSKKQNKKEDTISKLKKEENKLKIEKKEEEEEDHSEEEDEEKNQNVVKEQTVQKADKPKNIKELLGSMGDTKPKPKKKDTKPKQKKNYDEPKKHTFVNTKGTGNADKIDKEVRNNYGKKEFKNAKGLDEAAKENQKIKHTKDYLEKDTKKAYKDDNVEVAKPQFVTNKEGDENFVELNQNEDVRNNIYLYIYIIFIL